MYRLNIVNFRLTDFILHGFLIQWLFLYGRLPAQEIFTRHIRYELQLPHLIPDIFAPSLLLTNLFLLLRAYFRTDVYPIEVFQSGVSPHYHVVSLFLISSIVFLGRLIKTCTTVFHAFYMGKLSRLLRLHIQTVLATVHILEHSTFPRQSALYLPVVSPALQESKHFDWLHLGRFHFVRLSDFTTCFGTRCGCLAVSKHTSVDLHHQLFQIDHISLLLTFLLVAPLLIRLLVVKRIHTIHIRRELRCRLGLVLSSCKQLRLDQRGSL